MPAPPSGDEVRSRPPPTITSVSDTAGFFESFYADLLDRVGAVVRDEIAAAQPEPAPAGWLNAKSAAAYLDTTEEAIRSMIKRGDIEPERTPNGRLLFDRVELDRWVRGEPA